MNRLSFILSFLSILMVITIILNGLQKNPSSAQQKTPDGTWAETVFKIKKDVIHRIENQHIHPDSLNIDYERQYLAEYFPMEMSILMPYASRVIKDFLSSVDGSVEIKIIKRISRDFTNTSWINSEIERLTQEVDSLKRISGLLDLILIAHRTREVDNQLKWLNMSALKAAVTGMGSTSSYDLTEVNNKLRELDILVETGFDGIYENKSEAFDAAQRALALKKDILLSNMGIDMDQIVVSRYQIGVNSRLVDPSAMGTQPNNWSDQSSADRQGFNAEIAILSNFRGDIKYQRIFKSQNGSSLPDLKLHWDAERLMFSMVDETNRWQVYEIGIDGKGFRQVIEPPETDLEFFDATYLPNEKVIAVSNIGYHGVPCVNGSSVVGNMVLVNPADQKLRRLTFDQDANWHPVVMNNGRIMYVRWEYTDLTHYFSRMVMHMNPDGTEQRSLYGSGSVFPTSVMDVQAIPNHPTQFVGIISGHHGVVRSGRMILFDPAVSRYEEKGMVQEIPFRDRPIIPIVKDDMVGGVYPQFLKPYPIDEKNFLVTAKLTPNSLWGLYLVDIYDNLTLLIEQEGEGFIHGIPLKRRPVPPVIPEKVNENSQHATVFIQDIYEGEGLLNVPRGTVKSIRVLAYEYAYMRSPSDHLAQGIQSGWDIKRLLGEVPVESDGSAMFAIPANTPVSLQPLDEQGRAIQWMRSWMTGMPGEVVSCVGCHENQNETARMGITLASVKPPAKMKIPEGGVRPFTFELEIQPILDRACVACHDDSHQRNFTGGRPDQNLPKHLAFSKSYLDLHPFIHRQGPEAGMKVLYPYEYHASVSPLVQMLKRGHYGVTLTEKEWRTIYNWIDFNAPYNGSFVSNPIKCINSSEATLWDQYERRIELTNRYANGMGVDWRGETEAYRNYLANKPVGEPNTPAYEKPIFDQVRMKGFPFNTKRARSLQDKQNMSQREIEIAPGITMTFVRVPAGTFIMGENNRPSDYSPAHMAEIKQAFWMSATEITNEQFRTIFPNHDSRFFDQQWKDHVNEGYPANKPEQPVIRISWEEAMAFCETLSEHTGFNFSLPSEIQWEWACRAGSNTPYWFGSYGDDFSQVENMADIQLNKLAVRGVDPQPMKEGELWYPYYTWHPKDERVDDGNMLAVAPGSYKPNPWGLYDMHGNVSEWTRSDYQSYPPKNSRDGADNNQKKVVRGGSWIDHPKSSTSYFRKAYLPWQKVYNVGFRVVIEDHREDMTNNQ